MVAFSIVERPKIRPSSLRDSGIIVTPERMLRRGLARRGSAAPSSVTSPRERRAAP